jgi:alpha 1,2-mannosyltransferase
MPSFRLLSVRFTIALVLAGATFYTLFWRSEASSYNRIGHAFSSLREGIAHPAANAINLEAYLGLHHKDASFNKFAHRIESANDFLPHFAAVLELPNITMAEAKETCTWTKEDRINYQFGESLNEEGWVNASWTVRERQDWELQEPRGVWQNWIREKMLPYSDYKNKFSGRGIVIVGGNGKTVPRIKVILNALKHLKSEMPVEFHTYGNEMTKEVRDELLRLWPRSYFNDLAHPSNVMHSKPATLFINYHLKTAAVINSRFAEPLLLDSDNIPTIKPEELYESATYKEYGTVFWPDMSRTRPNNPVWVITNTKCKMDEWEQESGQMLVDKRKFFYHLQLAAWLNNVHGQYWNNFILGDKDMFRFSWHALKTPYGTPTKWLTSVGMNSELPKGGTFYCGHTFAQHHPDDGRVAFLHGGTLKTVAPEVLQWLRDERGGTFGWYKRSKHDEDMMAHSVFNGIPDGADYMPDKYKPIERATMCTDFEDIEARPFEELIPGFEKLFQQYGGYWQLDEKNKKKANS